MTKLYHDVWLLVMNYLLCETLSTLDFGLPPIWLVVCRILIRRAVDASYVSNEHTHTAKQPANLFSLWLWRKCFVCICLFLSCLFSPINRSSTVKWFLRKITRYKILKNSVATWKPHFSVSSNGHSFDKTSFNCNYTPNHHPSFECNYNATTELLWYVVQSEYGERTREGQTQSKCEPHSGIAWQTKWRMLHWSIM